MGIIKNKKIIAINSNTTAVIVGEKINKITEKMNHIFLDLFFGANLYTGANQIIDNTARVLAI